MPIIRAPLQFEGQFTQIPNTWLRDKNLSLKAKGLLAQLMSHSPGWSVSINGLMEANGCGKDAIRSAVLELEKHGYLVRIQGRHSSGTFSDTTWTTAIPESISPWAGYPAAGYPAADNPPTKNTKLKNTKLKKEYIALFDEIPDRAKIWTIEDEPEGERVGLAIYDDVFITFWEMYPRKVGKLNARRAFDQAAKHNVVQMLEGVKRLVDDPNLPGVSFIPYPATWIRSGGWEDEPYPKKAGKYDTPAAELPTARLWVKALHNGGEHFECRVGEFGCKS